MDSAEFRELVYGPREDLARFFGVSLAQLRRYLAGASRIPPAIARLARARFAGELEEIYGPEAAELRIVRGELVVPGWRRGLTLQELRTLWVRIQAVAAAESKVAQLERDLEAAAAGGDTLAPCSSPTSWASSPWCSWSPSWRRRCSSPPLSCSSCKAPPTSAASRSTSTPT